MAVEIYLEPELQELTQNQELTEEWKKMCETLDLKGQIEMLPNKESSPSPYLFMNSSMLKIFSILCPSVVDYTQYNKSTIPYEVLKEIAICKEKNYFDAIKIWYDDISPDPLVVGYMKNEGQYNETQHLIARFGDEVLPIEILKDKAIARLTKSISNQLKQISNSLTENIEDFINKNQTISIDCNPTNWNHKHI
ncbi:hypothetical protein [uncultured Winogradskyella sp.]|uniref:hypothetical protein n=1 Tax=uncultured Winogradskyella sp. TaxID=395353 RepID=UPI002601D36F|nr:hypothetical protein [uncultured Winogradskyella sp.]